MVKLIQFDSIDEYGVHVKSIDNSTLPLMKLASNEYSKDIVDAIASLKRESQYYYVVINALGSLEMWGSNRNGDGFPRAGLSHYSLRSDMGTENDYGYKTFEMYAHLYKNHCNKNPKKSFGKVIVSIWNPKLERVELIVGIDRIAGADIIEAIENGDNVAVSMGCLTNPEYPILTKFGYKPIKDISVGDEVITHEGRWKKVSHLRHGQYSGELIKLNFRGLPIPLELTANHPMMSKLFRCESQEKSRPYISDESFESVRFEWNAAGLLEAKDHIEYIVPEYNKSEFCGIDSIDLAKIMGYYLAEGSFVYNDGKPCIIQLSCHIDDDLPREVPKILQNIYPDITCKIKPHHNSRKGLVVEIFSTRLACFMEKMMKHGSKNKVIPPEIFVSDNEIKLAYICSWFNGDGWLDKKGVHISTSNINLVLQGRDLLASMGIASSIYKIKHKEGSGFNNKNTIEYTLNVSSIDAEPMSKYSSLKMKDIESIIEDRIKTGSTVIKFNSDGTKSYSIKEIEKRFVENIKTYNFEVEDDESYSAAGLASHNCRVKWDQCNICGNKAKTIKEYCKHLKNHMGKVVTKDLADLWSKETGKTILPGTIVFAYNHFPKFFDISKVYVGADSTAYVLGKVASSNHIIPSAYIADAEGIKDDDIDKLSYLGKKSTMKKESDIDKEIPPSEIDGKVIGMKKKIDETLQKTIDHEESIPNRTLDFLAENVPVKSLFSTMLGLGIHPKPAEFQRIIIIKTGRPDIADFLEKNRLIFDPNSTVDPIDVPIGTQFFDSNVARILSNFIEKRSCFPDYLEGRMEKHAGLFTTERPPEPSIINPTTLLAGIAAIYAGLKMKALGIGPQQVIDVFRNQPWIPAVAGAGLAYKLLVHDKQRELDKILVPAHRYEDAFKNTYFSGHYKTASAGEHLALGAMTGLAALPAAYVLNAYNRKSEYEKGQSLFPGAGTRPHYLAGVVGGGTALGSLIKEKYADDLLAKIRSLK